MKWVAVIAAMTLVACNQSAPSAPDQSAQGQSEPNQASSNQASAAPAEPTAPQPLTLVSAKSQLSFISIKNAHIAEVHQFNELSGNLDLDGNVEFSVMLGSVDTAIEIRDQRMREHLFDVAQFPVVAFNAEISRQGIDQLASGDSMELTLDGQLSVLGQEHPLQAAVKVTRLSADRLQVASAKPIVVSADRVGLSDGVDQLQQLAGLQGISYAVPVSFLLVFES